MPASGPEPRHFARDLLAWFADHGRHDLPWQRDPTPYRVWISEIMLQQTQVATVAAYFPRFLRRFPSVTALAAAPLDAVLHQWSGLGYYARARNLHRAAGVIRDLHGGAFPADIAALSALPGIGRSTAAAILALACNERHPILDGNVKRVLARWFGVEGFPGSARVAAELWRLSDAVTPAAQARGFTQAIMDLGATVCARARPVCAACPVAQGCTARARGRQRALPSPRPRRARPQRAVWWLVLRRGGAVLLERRPAHGLWGGLWSFPEFATRAAATAAAGLRGAPAARVVAQPPFRHAFTHFDLDIRALIAEVDAPPNTLVEGGRWTWYNARRPAKLGLAAPVTVLIGDLASSTRAGLTGRMKGASDGPHR